MKSAPFIACSFDRRGAGFFRALPTAGEVLLLKHNKVDFFAFVFGFDGRSIFFTAFAGTFSCSFFSSIKALSFMSLLSCSSTKSSKNGKTEFGSLDNLIQMQEK